MADAKLKDRYFCAFCKSIKDVDWWYDCESLACPKSCEHGMVMFFDEKLDLAEQLLQEYVKAATIDLAKKHCVE